MRTTLLTRGDENVMVMTTAQKKSIQRRTVAYASALPNTTIKAYVWIPDQDPIAIVQIAHGMAEYAQRYDDFARFLACNGFLVCANDHIGHGGSCPSERWGLLPENADEIMVADMRTLHQKMTQVNGEVPYFVIGHSMGSFLTRVYMSRFGDELAGIVLSGTAQMPQAVSTMGNTLAHLIGRARGMDHRSKFLDGMGAGGYGKKVKDAKTDLDWLNTSDKAVNAYASDSACGFMFSAGGYCALTNLTRTIAQDETARRVPSDLPVLFISGSDDPVGNFGEGPKKAAQQMRDTSHNHVSLKIYEGMRHEILNEPRHAQVYADIHRFLDACVNREEA